MQWGEGNKEKKQNKPRSEVQRREYTPTAKGKTVPRRVRTMTEGKNINAEGTGRKEESVPVTASNQEIIKEKSGETAVIPTPGKPRLTKPPKERGKNVS